MTSLLPLGRWVAAIVLCSSLAWLPAQSAHAQDAAAVTSRFVFFSGGAFGGQASVSYSGSWLSGSLSADLAPSPLMGARFESDFLRYLALGGQLSTSFWRGVRDADRNLMVDFSLTPRLRFPIVVGGRLLLEPYVVVPVGFSVAVWNANVAPDSSTGLSRSNPGWNLGALAGVTVLSRSGLGAMLEFGIMHHAAYDRDKSDARYGLTLNQATLHVGVVYAF